MGEHTVQTNPPGPRSEPWHAVWPVLLAGDAPALPTQSSAVAVDDEFDFLAEPAPAPAELVVTAGTPDPARLAALHQYPTSQAAHDVGRWLVDDLRLDRLDAAAVLWVAEVLGHVSLLDVPEHGPLLRLLQRGARSADPQLAVAAAHAIGQTRARAAQLAVVARLHADPQSLGHAGVDKALAALQVVADGRCVREMEAMLLERGAVLSDTHAWQARHIVQVIRRGGRK